VSCSAVVLFRFVLPYTFLYGRMWFVLHNSQCETEALFILCCVLNLLLFFHGCWLTDARRLEGVTSCCSHDTQRRRVPHCKKFDHNIHVALSLSSPLVISLSRKSLFLCNTNLHRLEAFSTVCVFGRSRLRNSGQRPAVLTRIVAFYHVGKPWVYALKEHGA
jgi:hypothetical protein